MVSRKMESSDYKSVYHVPLLLRSSILNKTGVLITDTLKKKCSFKEAKSKRSIKAEREATFLYNIKGGGM